MREKNKEKRVYIYKLIVTIIFGLAVFFVINNAQNYVRNEISDKTNLVINNSNVTKSLKNDVIVENDVVYISTKDIANFFDGNIFYDNKYDQIITTSDKQVATLKIDKNKCTINSSDVELIASAKKYENEFYLPFSEISKSVYNVETRYISGTDTVVLVSLDRALTYANSTKNNAVKYKPTIFSKTIDKIEKGDNVTIVSTKDNKQLDSSNKNLEVDNSKENNNWTKVTTENGKIGYVKTSSLANEKQVRNELIMEKQIDGNISLVWEYFSEYGSAPNRTEKIKGVNVVAPTFFTVQKKGKGNIVANVGQAGKDYIKWAHDNGYKVWASVSNQHESSPEIIPDTTSEILNDYKLREDFINNIVTVVLGYDLDGINLDFEYMYEEDKDMYSRLVIELAPRLKELGKVLSVDVTAPDGSPMWSLCFDRNVIGEVADYIVFMAYDQHGKSSKEAGTVAGYDWAEANIKKFIGTQEEVKPEKLILGAPFYTRIWTEENGKLDSRTYYMKDTYEKIPEGTEIVWNDSVKQNYAEYEKNGVTYKVWIEDEKSIQCKLDLVKTYNLAGAGYWSKGGETKETWDVISEALNVK